MEHLRFWWNWRAPLRKPESIGGLLSPALSSTSVWRRGRWNGVRGFNARTFVPRNSRRAQGVSDAGRGARPGDYLGSTTLTRPTSMFWPPWVWWQWTASVTVALGCNRACAEGEM